MTTIAISSGHGAKVAGACGIIREHEEAVRVVNQLAIELQHCGVDVHTFEDTVSHHAERKPQPHRGLAQFERQRDLDISVHFNAYEQVSKPMGTEVLYVTQETLAAQLSAAIANVGFINRGAKETHRPVFPQQHRHAPAVLLEICFVDSEADCDIYPEQFKEICIKSPRR